MKILLLGGSGMIGSHFKQFSKFRELTMAPTRIEMDLSKEITHDSISSEINTLVFCAQYRDYKKEILDKREVKSFFSINGMVLNNLLIKKNNIKKIVYLSTGGIYRHSMSLLNEDSPINELSEMNHYFRSKKETESMLIEQFSHLEITILRLFTVYGRGANSSSLFEQIQKKIVGNEEIYIANNGGDLLRPLNVLDVVKCLDYLIANQITGTFNLGGPKILNMKQILDMVSRALGCKVRVFENGERPKVIAPDNIFIKSVGFTPIIEFENYLKN